MKQYCVGFVFNEDLSFVLLTEKQHPEWQKGKWNGIGGHIEGGEHPMAAMKREAEEEAGIEGAVWKYIGVMLCEKEWVCHVFQTVISDGQCDAIHRRGKNDVGEWIRMNPVENVPKMEVIDNLKWLVPFARHAHIQGTFFSVKYPSEWIAKTHTGMTV